MTAYATRPYDARGHVASRILVRLRQSPGVAVPTSDLIYAVWLDCDLPEPDGAQPTVSRAVKRLRGFGHDIRCSTGRASRGYFLVQP